MKEDQLLVIEVVDHNTGAIDITETCHFCDIAGVLQRLLEDLEDCQGITIDRQY